MLAVLNNTDATEFNPNNSFTTGFQLGYKSTYLNVLYGKQGTSVEPTFQIDLTGGYQLSPKFYLGLNSSYNTTGPLSFYGAALYPKLSIGSALEIGVRGEYFSEINGGVGAIGQYDLKGDANIIAATLTASYSIGDFCIKPEIRIDSASEATFLDDKQNPDQNLSSFLLAVMYSF